jgi:hypothetical protein
MMELANGSSEHGYDFIIIGDTKSPKDFALDGCHFFSIQDQLDMDLRIAELCPEDHYSRKNIGYLIAMHNKASLIIDTDDDNIPNENFFLDRNNRINAPLIRDSNWVNIYRYFSEALIWPRGLPLERINSKLQAFEELPVHNVKCPIQQGLVDINPDVDAIYRLILPLPQTFRKDRRIVMGRGSRCPFNSQNTTWWPEAYTLLYLPGSSPFRMTDIWRSFVAQRIAWENDWGILFHEPTLWQDRNDHDLTLDFSDEVQGYLNNNSISETLVNLTLKPGVENIPDNMRLCYESLVRQKILDKRELLRLDAWLDDMVEINKDQLS